MESQLEILQRTELALIKDFHRICVENNLRYVLAFGTMIGCVRHKGYIPWDDDIDVVMPWKDYCKFNEIANSTADKRYMVFNDRTVSNYAYPFSKYIKKESSAIFEYPFVHYYNQPIYIDVFPALYLPSNLERYKSVLVSNFFWGQTGRMKTSSPYKHTKRGFIAKSGMFLFYCLNKLIPQNKCYNKMMKRALSVKREDASAYYIGDMYSEINAIGQFQMPLDVFDNRILMPFEDTELYIPKDYDTILRRMYGDYMQLPPEEKRKSHGFKFVSDQISYQEYDRQQKEKALNHTQK